MHFPWKFIQKLKSSIKISKFSYVLVFDIEFYDQVWRVTKSTSNSLYFSGESMNYDWPTIIKDITSYWYCTFTFCLLLAACGI